MAQARGGLAQAEAGLALAERNYERYKALAFEENRVDYPSIFDPTGRISLSFEQVPPNTVPATIVIDREGRIAAVIRKAVLQEELDAIVAEVVGEAKA